MRAKDVAQLVAAWSNILDGVEKTSLTTEIGELCFEVIGQYVEWIDINLVGLVLIILFNIRVQKIPLIYTYLRKCK